MQDNYRSKRPTSLFTRRFGRSVLRSRRLIQNVVFVFAFMIAGSLFIARTLAQTPSVNLFGNSVPASIDSGDGQAVEVGVKFKSDVSGTVSGVRFYKSTLNTGTHVGNLWTSNGTLLASATFTNETASGWQEVSFAQPVTIQANTVYVASYHTPTGHYSDTVGGLAQQIDSGPLHALADGASGPNGVYAYGSASSFPQNSWESSNYWVDVTFTPGDSTGGTTPIGGGGAVSGSLSVDQQISIHQPSASTTIVSPVFSTTASNELLLAFIMTDGTSGSGTKISSVTGGGLTWSLRKRVNAQGGATEVWQAVAPSQLTNVKVTAKRASGSYVGSMLIVAFKGADTTTLGAVAGANAYTGAPTVKLTTTRNGSWVWAAGNDYVNAKPRTVGPDQVMVDEYLPIVNDTFWVQRQQAVTPNAGTVVTMNDTAPTDDRWNMIAIEVLPAAASPGPDTTPPSAPTNLAARAISTSQIDLTWSASADNVGVTGYNIHQNGVKIGTSSGTNFSSTNLTPGTTYSYTVSAFDAAGNVSVLSNSAGASTPSPTDTTPPSVPGNLTATAVSPTTVNLAWDASTDDTGVTQYLILRNDAVIATSTTTTYSDTSAASNTSYTYQVQARDAAGNTSAPSNPITVTTPNPTDTTPPSVPAGVNASAVSATQVNIVWDPSTDNIAVASYNIYRDGVRVGSAATASFGEANLTPNTTYTYTVSALDGAGNESARSSPALVRTPEINPPGGGSAITSRPNDGSGYWPDFSNTGYNNTPANVAGSGLPAYSGLSDYTTGMSSSKYLRVEYPNGSVIAYKRFLASKMEIFGDNLTFIGCLFEGHSPNDNLVQIYADTSIKFYYSTFKPAAYSTPPGNDGTVSSAHQPPGTPFDKSWQYVTTMRNSVVTMDHNDIWGNAGLQMVTGFPGRPSTWTNNYIHDQSDTANDIYHHDGLGPQSEGDGGPMIIDHNTIASNGNTNALALQGSGVYDNIRFTNNYVSGWGYALSFGVANPVNATNITVTGNVFSAELTQLFAFLYGNRWGGTARGSTWRNNFLQVRPGDNNTRYSPTENGRYLWPDSSSHTDDYGG